jgi:hypothetical protein
MDARVRMGSLLGSTTEAKFKIKEVPKGAGQGNLKATPKGLRPRFKLT